MGTPQVFEEDCPEVKTALSHLGIDIEKWIHSLPAKQLGRLSEMVDKFSSTGLTDTSVRSYAQCTP
eukprot:298771-Heterocapsa_arctica.AAC.1